MSHELINRATDCMRHVEHFSRKLGGVHDLARKLTKRSAGCRTANLTVDEAAWCSWAMGVVVNLKRASIDEGLTQMKQRMQSDGQQHRDQTTPAVARGRRQRRGKVRGTRGRGRVSRGTNA